MIDFSTLFLGALPPHGANISHNANGSAENVLPDNILRILSLLPSFQLNPLTGLFMLLYNVVGRYIGINPTHILTFFAVVWAASKLWHQLYSTFRWLLHQHLMASIDISSSDGVYLYLTEWLASQPNLLQSRFLTAQRVSEDSWEDEGGPDLKKTCVSPDGSNVGLNFSKRESTVPVRFMPAIGKHEFRFRGTRFALEKERVSLFNSNAGIHGMFKEEERIVLSCFGRSPEPIKQLLQHAKEEYYNSHQAKTRIWAPVKDIRPWRAWQEAASRLTRPMSTVVLDDEQKVRILSDFREFLVPTAKRFYAERGIPLRRGYLFHGPPGTGKTSLCFALAGVFGLDIFVIRGLGSELTEEDLMQLFISLPPRCVVLLEDIDAAGVKRIEDPTADSSDKKGISLSGLLNAIDGLTSQEGRVLIMTTNKPDNLDKALIRPGRIDLQVVFTNATQEQAKKLFVRMYEPDSSMVSELEHVSTQFAAKIPPEKFSPAEIQGFLLQRKGEAQRALAEVDEWVKDELERKRLGTNVLRVQ
ncbi:hypothetical protein VTI28DRAFT_5484 [Corynascus sepedonium]